MSRTQQLAKAHHQALGLALGRAGDHRPWDQLSIDERDARVDAMQRLIDLGLINAFQAHG